MENVLSQQHDSLDGTARTRATSAALRHLRQADARLGAIVDRVGPYRLDITPDPFIALIGSIVHQQVSMSAAATIYRRLRALCPRNRLSPPAVLKLDHEHLRSAGLSRQKAAYIHGLAETFTARTLTAAKLRRMSDDEVLVAAMQLKGVGRWTAEMLLIFCLDRPDVWPVDDLGLKKAVGRLLGVDGFPPVDAMHALAEPWRPYRTFATWYLWRSLDHAVLPGIAY